MQSWPLHQLIETVWCLPHHGAYNPKKPDKLRVVFDCSAKFCSVFLNDTLTGPDLINCLIGVLCRFIAMICDVEKMFHQFCVTSESRNYLRFLWWEHGELEKEPQDYRWRSTSLELPHLLDAQTLDWSIWHSNTKLTTQQRRPSSRKSSVDDRLARVASVKEAKRLIIDAQELCKAGGLRPYQFKSNPKEVLKSWSLDCVNLPKEQQPLNLSN